MLLLFVDIKLLPILHIDYYLLLLRQSWEFCTVISLAGIWDQDWGLFCLFIGEVNIRYLLLSTLRVTFVVTRPQISDLMCSNVLGMLEGNNVIYIAGIDQIWFVVLPKMFVLRKFVVDWFNFLEVVHPFGSHSLGSVLSTFPKIWTGIGAKPLRICLEKLKKLSREWKG